MTTAFRVFLLVLASAQGILSMSAKQEEPPNIILILVDDMGWSDIGCFGSEIETPHIDRLASQGIRFTNFHNTSKCFPSRASLLTGTYAQLNGNHQTHGKLENSVTLGEVLKEAGYRTLAVGKHHGTENLYDRGFDHYYGLRDGASNHFNPGYQRPGEPLPAQKRHRTFCFDSFQLKPFTPGLEADYYSTDAYTDWALQFLQRYQEEEPHPFFLYLSYQAPHDPLQAHPEDIAKYRETYRVGYEDIAEKRYQRQQEQGLIDERYPRSAPLYRPWQSLSENEKEDQALRMAVYAAMMDRVDQSIGRLIQHLKKTGQYHNTLILFTSDNGSSAEIVEIGDGEIGDMDRWASLGPDWANVGNTPFRHYKNDSYEGGIRSPLVAHWPKGITNPGRVSEFSGHFIDVMPTLLEISNGTYPSEYDNRKIVPASGISFANVLKDKAAPARQVPLYWQWQNSLAIADGHWKLVKDGDSNWELFDLRRDQTETNDLADQHPDLVKQLSAQHAEWLNRARETYQRYQN